LATEETPKRLREWKTPPLWGLRDSGPYLHDGRAETVDQAITLHGGEAAFSVENYRALRSDARTQLLTFLATLAAPDPADAPPPKTGKKTPRPGKPQQRELTAGIAAAKQ
jgi:cytochrome c peroxidase